MNKTTRHLKGHKEKIIPAFIKSIRVNTTTDKEFNLEIRLTSGKDEYIISSIKATEINLSLLWYMYETNEKIEITRINVGDYIIMIVLGLYIALIQTDDYLWSDINSLDLDLEDEDENENEMED